MRSSTAINLAAFDDQDSFQEMWCKANWQGDDVEMRRDHHAMQKLLELSRSAGTIADVRPALDLIIELFKVHAQIEHQLLGSRLPAHSIDYALTLIEQLDETAEDDPLYNIRAANVLHQLSLLMAVEEDLYDEMDRSFKTAILNGPLLQQRERLLQDADILVKAPQLAQARHTRLS